MLRLLFSVLFFFLLAPTIEAHMLLPYTNDTYLDKPNDIEMRFVFIHPVIGGQPLDMGGIQEFYALQKCADLEVKKIDFKYKLKQIEWKNPDGKSNKAFAASLTKKDLQNLGDYVFCIVPGYYYDEGANAYLQQITKLIMNVGGIRGNFNEPCGLPCEIVPLCKPYDLWEGNVFNGRVLSEGKPVPNAEIEVAYLNHQVNLSKNTLQRRSRIDYPHRGLRTQTIYADDHGYFSFGLPEDGWWGFAALNVGPKTQHNGKDLSQDAVIWVQVVGVK